jgi:hypothetical protein
MALVLIPRHQHALVLIFVPFFLEFADRAMMHDVSENGENICLPSTPVRDEGCLLDYLRSPQNRTSPYSSGSRHRVPFSGYESYDRGNIARAPDSVRRNLVGKLSSPELFRGSVSKQDNRQHIISPNAKQSRSLIKRAGRWPSIGNMLPEQVLTTELVQKIVDMLAEPIYSKHGK